MGFWPTRMCCLRIRHGADPCARRGATVRVSRKRLSYECLIYIYLYMYLAEGSKSVRDAWRSLASLCPGKNKKPQSQFDFCGDVFAPITHLVQGSLISLPTRVVSQVIKPRLDGRTEEASKSCSKDASQSRGNVPAIGHKTRCLMSLFQ